MSVIKDNLRPAQLFNNAGSTVYAVAITLTASSASSAISEEMDVSNFAPISPVEYANILSEDEVDFLAGSAARDKPIEGTLEDLERSLKL